VFDNGAWAQGIESALASAGLTGKVTIVGNGINSDVLSELKANQIAAWSADSFEIYGIGSFDSLLRALTDSPGIDANSALPFQLVTAGTANNVKVPYAEPATALSQYEKLWQW
jgi:ABC-type sugar transport system substrate-binding protein